MEISAVSVSSRVVLISPEPEIAAVMCSASPDAVKEPEPDSFNFKVSTIIPCAVISPDPETSIDSVFLCILNDEIVPVSDPEAVNCVKLGMVIKALQRARSIVYPR